VREPEQVDAVIAATTARSARLDVLVNNAAIANGATRQRRRPASRRDRSG